MLQFTVEKNVLQLPLLTVAGAVDRKQSMPVLSNILLTVEDNCLVLSATDLEIDVTARVNLNSCQGEGQTTVPAKKFVDIIKSLNDDSVPSFSMEDNQLVIKTDRSKFKLSVLPPDTFPCLSQDINIIELTVPKQSLLHLLQTTYFSMSQQDVRAFLNGMLLSFDNGSIMAVATDGHRLAICQSTDIQNNNEHRIIIPRRAIMELLRLLNSINDETVFISAGESHFCLQTKMLSFNTKLVESRYPPYQKAIPKALNTFVIVDRDGLKKALNRIVILAHEKTKGIILSVQPGKLLLTANNQNQEEANEVVPAEVDGNSIKLGLNAAYLLDVINHCDDGMVRL